MGDTSDFEGCITHGPWGSSSMGKEWVYKPEGFITKIIVHFEEVVYGIKFESSSSKGGTESSLFGTSFTSNRTHQISIDYPEEYLIFISGTYGSHRTHDINVLQSICFMTNQNYYGPFGSNDGTGFSHYVKGGVISGFHGRALSYLNAIGVYVKPTSPSVILSRVSMPREVGPWGASKGKPWDDGVFSTIKQVSVYLGELNAIDALQFKYQKSDGTSVLSQIHGGANDCKIELVNLEDNDEFLMGISGFYGPVEENSDLKAITSISFHTNNRTHGPFGEESGAGYIYFSSTASPGKVVGFHGRNNGFLSAIGVHTEYF